MLFEDADILGLKIFTPEKHGDSRGFFSEVYKASDWRAAGLDLAFLQDNHSYSAPAGTLRGLHFQTAPAGQDKLIRVVRGRILDVVVDLRRSSLSFGRHFAVELSAKNWRQLLVPIGFAHGFVTLEPHTEVLYKVTSPYSPSHERGLAWNDPDLGIDWNIPSGGPLLSERDTKWPRLRDLRDVFA